MNLLVARVSRSVRRAMEGEGTGHDWWHVWRVWKTADRLAKTEPRADRTVVSLGALLHDVGDWKFHAGDEEAAPREAARVLRRFTADAATIDRVRKVCREISFKGAGVADRPSSLEARIVQDADRLDAIGAVGIARTFAYGGARGRLIYEPGVRPVLHGSFAAYKKSRSHTINHFHEKLLLLKDRLHTRGARRIARERHEYLVGFLKRFHAEWEGRA
ncbi:MAG TPA: HD domain-containing protein [Planctomycetota bacterium]|nr:HD domain-containing protein [Planctomycetota bacterium]